MDTILEPRAARINAYHRDALILADQARGKCNEAVEKALLCGRELNAVKKELGHGNWLPWLKTHCPGIPERTAQNYMRLANPKHVSDLKRPNGLRQAYIAVGIIKTDVDARTTEPPDFLEDDTLPIKYLVRELMLILKPISTPEPEMLAVLRPLMPWIEKYWVTSRLTTVDQKREFPPH
jgi:hypothetical protein